MHQEQLTCQQLISHGRHHNHHTFRRSWQRRWRGSSPKCRTYGGGSGRGGAAWVWWYVSQSKLFRAMLRMSTLWLRLQQRWWCGGMLKYAINTNLIVQLSALLFGFLSFIIVKSIDAGILFVCLFVCLFGCMIVSPKFALSQGFASKCSQINLAPIVEIPFWSHQAVNPTEPPRCLNAVRRWSSFSISLSSKILKSASTRCAALSPL